MTTLFSQSVTCASCGENQEVTLLGSTNAFGSMDLDMRPPPMDRDTLAMRIHRCGKCGYCAPALGSAEGVDLSQVGRPSYASLLGDTGFPALANQFRAYAYLATSAGNPVGACWAAIRAAWVCDDGGPEYGHVAIECRKEALQAIERIHADDKTFCPDLMTDGILRLDLLRRSGDFQAVLDAAAQLRAGNLPDILERIAAFQAKQAGQQVAACFTVQEALEQ